VAEFSWDFGDDTSPPRFERCKHFYTVPKDAKSGIGFSWETWKLTRKIPQREFTITVTVTPPSKRNPVTFDRKVTAVLAQRAGMGLIGMQIVSFSVTILVAVLAAFGAQYATTPDSLTVASRLPAVLFGFGLDQIRGKAVPQ
jgi:hypothetical protein